MKTAGIVSEYNPFHRGHRWMVEEIRRQGYEAVACVMSGPFVQRAEPAFLPTHTRTALALAGGVDLVLRLPVGAALRSAEGFARGAVGILAALGGIDALFFGAETPDARQFTACAELLETNAFRQALKTELERGDSFAAARARAAEKLLPGAGRLLESPNNILGVEYCKALGEVSLLQGGGALPRPFPLPRMGAAHDGRPKDGFASASWIRRQAREADGAGAERYLPPECRPLFRQALERGEAADAARWETALLARLRGLEAAAFAAAFGAGEGLENRVQKAAQAAVGLEGLYAGAKSKRYAESRVRRLAVSAALGLREGEGRPPFLHVLGASERGRLLLKAAKQKAALPLGTSMARLEKLGPEAARAARREALAEDIHALCRERPAPGGLLYTEPAVFL